MSRLLEMIQIMQGIVDSNADDDRPDAQHNNGNGVVEQRHACNGEEPAENNGGTNPQHVGQAPIMEIEQEQDERDSDECGNETVSLDLIGIAHRNQWSPHRRDTH